MMDLSADIKKLARRLRPEIIRHREHLHAHPELSNNEKETAAYIFRTLKTMGVDEVRGEIGGHGIVAVVSGNGGKGKLVAVRAELDALPILEKSDKPYQSKNPGVMHACGHDVHMSCTLGALGILIELKDHWKGKVAALFQPSEEKMPGGAMAMISAGVLKELKPEVIYALHVMPEMEAGTVGFRSGEYMASADEIYITVQGRGGHGAMPHQNIDPVLIAAHIITGLQQVVSRRAFPFTPTVLSFGKVIADGATNVIPGKVLMEGTFRTMNEVWRKEAHAMIVELSTAIARGMGGSCNVKIEKGLPVLANDPDVTAAAQKAAVQFLGNQNVIDLPLRMTSDDFAYYTQHIPGCYFRLGVGNKKEGITSPVHTPTFDVDPAALETGPGILAWLLASRLNGGI